MGRAIGVNIYVERRGKGDEQVRDRVALGRWRLMVEDSRDLRSEYTMGGL
jgi:hypothetical protein